MAPDQYFLVVYHLDDRSVDVVGFGEDFEKAARVYTEREEALQGDDAREVVLLGADSLETIKRTHSHYFREDRGPDLFDRLMEDLRTAGSR